MLIEDLKNFAKQIGESYLIGKNISLRYFDKIFVCGMGGSAISGDLLKDYLSDKRDIPVSVCEERLPAFADKKSLVFIVSYSGNTKETISMLREAIRRKAQTVILTSGGYLSKQKGAIIVPSGMYPRSAVGYLFFPMLNVLGIKYNVSSIIKAVKAVDKVECKKLASSIEGKTPVIYAGHERYKSIAYRWETQFNENSKVIAHSNFLPEINHNEVESRDLKKFRFIILSEKKQRITAKKFLKPYNLSLRGNSELARMFYAIHFGDWVSYYLGILRGVSFETKRIRFIKNYNS